MRYILIILPFIMIVACQTGQKQSRKDLYNEVMKIHDDAMADMGQLNNLQKAVQDSLDQDSLAEMKQQMFSKVDQQLSLADSVMWAWMHAFDQEAASEKSDSAIQYLQKEEVRIKHVQEVMNKAIQAAQRLTQEQTTE